MHDPIFFEVLGVPTGKGRPRIVRRANSPYPVAITPDKTRQAEQSLLAQALPHLPKTPLECPVELLVIAYMPIPKSKPKKWRHDAEEGVIRPTGKPDLDNIVKMVLDSLNGVAFKDDAQVVNIAAAKWYDAIPRIMVKITDASL